MVTIIGLLTFQKEKCDFVVLECGLGGRLDATNVVGYPDVLCSAVTSVGMDHMDVLGNSLESISKEKSFVIKKDVPCVLGPSCAMTSAFKARVAETGSPATWIENQGSFECENNLIVESIIGIVCASQKLPVPVGLSQKIASWRQPCRFEQIPDSKVVLDVCHNIDGFKAVLKQIPASYPEVTEISVVFGISKGKRLDQIVELLENSPLVKDLHIVSRPHMRLYKCEDAHKLVASLGSTKLRDLRIDQEDNDTHSDSASSEIRQENNIAKTLDYVLGRQNEKSLVVVCGSFFIMSDVKTYFGQHMEVDNIM